MVLSRSRIVIARSPKGDEAIHNFAPDMDCFAFARNDDLCSDLKSSRFSAEVHLSHLHRLSSGLKDEYSWIKWPAFHSQAGATVRPSVVFRRLHPRMRRRHRYILIQLCLRPAGHPGHRSRAYLVEALAHADVST